MILFWCVIVSLYRNYGPQSIIHNHGAQIIPGHRHQGILIAIPSASSTSCVPSLPSPFPHPPPFLHFLIRHSLAEEEEEEEEEDDDEEEEAAEEAEDEARRMRKKKKAQRARKRRTRNFVCPSWS